MKKFTGILSVVLAAAMLSGIVGCTQGNPGAIDQTAAPTTAPTAEQTPEPTRAPKENVAKIILLLGQSNAVGATMHTPLKKHLGSDKYKQLSKGYENVRLLYFAEAGNAEGKDYQTNFKEKYFTDLSKLFGKVKLGMSWNSVFFGPEMGMAEYLSTTYPDDTFYIIKAAKGAVSINSSFLDDGYCWRKMDEMTSKAIELLKEAGYTPEISGICWMQGENEALSEDSANHYLEYQSDLAKRLREKYKDYAPYGGIPFIDAGISSYWKYYKTVNAAKAEFAAQSDLNYYFDTMELGYTYKNEPEGGPDYAHFDSDCVWDLGQQFAKYFDEAYKKVK